MPASSFRGQGWAVSVPCWGLPRLMKRRVRRYPLQLDPGAADHPTHRKTQQVHRPGGAERRLDLAAQPLGQLLHGRGAEAHRQVGHQQLLALLAQVTPQPIEHPRAVHQAVQQHERWCGRLR